MNPEKFPVVLLHGLACDPYLWETIEGYLQRAGFQIHQPLVRNQDSISKMAEFVLKEVEGRLNIYSSFSHSEHILFWNFLRKWIVWRQEIEESLCKCPDVDLQTKDFVNKQIKK